MNPRIEILESNTALDRFQRAAEKALTEVVDRLQSAEKLGGKAWLTNAEAMEYLGLSRPTLARYRAAGTLPYSKLGSSIYYKLESVEALLESRLTQSIKPNQKPRTHTGGISAPEAKGTQRP